MGAVADGNSTRLELDLAELTDAPKVFRLARNIHESLNADPSVPGLRVPTVFVPTDGISPPTAYDLDVAEHSFVVVLADAHVIDRDSGLAHTWASFIGDLWVACQGTQHRFFPVQLDETAWDFDDRLSGTSFVRAFAEKDQGKRVQFVMQRLIIELCRTVARVPLLLGARHDPHARITGNKGQWNRGAPRHGREVWTS